MSDADYTLSDLYDRGIDALASDEPEPGTTFEVGPGLVGTLVPPTMNTREAVVEAGDEIQALLKDDNDLDEELLDRIDETDAEEELVELHAQLYRDDVSLQEINMTSNRVACKQAVAALQFEDGEPDYGDLVPEMASVVRAHFLSLNAATPSGQETS